MTIDFRQSYFELFGLPEAYDLDLETLSVRYRDLQRAVHPDRFASGSDQERRLSVQQASRVNEAFQTLKQPLTRARYLLELKGLVLDDIATNMDPGFLMEQMELREGLAGVRSAQDPFGTLNRLREDIEARDRELGGRLGNLLASGAPEALTEAGEIVRKMQFMQRLLDEAADVEEALVHEL